MMARHELKVVGVLLLALGFSVPGATGAASTPELAVIVHPSADGRPLDAAALAAIFTGTERKWKNGTDIKVFNLAAQSLERSEFDRVVLHRTPEEAAQFWVDRLVRGEGQPPTQVPKPDLLAKVVANLPGAIGYLPPQQVDPSKVRVVARIRDGKVVAP